MMFCVYIMAFTLFDFDFSLSRYVSRSFCFFLFIESDVIGFN